MTRLPRAILGRKPPTLPQRAQVTRTWLSQPSSPITRRSFTVNERAREVEPGGQRKLIVAACLVVPVLGITWLRGREKNQSLGDAGRGANQEYKEKAEGNE